MFTARTRQVSGSAIVLAAGLYALVLGEAVFLLAALLLPPTAVQNDATFFVYGRFFGGRCWLPALQLLLRLPCWPGCTRSFRNTNVQSNL